MIKSKPWDWSKNKNEGWLTPSIESCYLAESWKSKGFNKFLDLGCGLGRHSIYFAKKGFSVNAVDLSEFALNYLNDWAEKEKLNIKTETCDMLNLPFNDDSFDCIIDYNVIYHTDTLGFLKSLEEVKRVLKSDGELFITLISKNTWSFKNADNYRRIDENTTLRNEDDTERNVPHFYVDIQDIRNYFKNFDFVVPPLEQTEYDIENTGYYSTHFNLILHKKY